MNPLNRDLEDIKEKFPKLGASLLQAGGAKLVGAIDICDLDGNFFRTFEIEVHIPRGYPYVVPTVFETGGQLKRTSERHVSGDGSCCLDIPHVLQWKAKRGLPISEFMEEVVYPFFANQVYYDLKERFAGKEYPHDFEGIGYYYRENLGLLTPNIAIGMIKAVVSHSLPGRNDDCLCGSGIKFKKCHEAASEVLDSVDIKQLAIDLEYFKKVRV